MIYKWVYVYIDIHIHCCVLLFVSLIIWGFAIKLSGVLGPLGQHLLIPLSGYIAKQSILLLHSLGGSATTRTVQCFALAMKPG